MNKLLVKYRAVFYLKFSHVAFHQQRLLKKKHWKGLFFLTAPQYAF